MKISFLLKLQAADVRAGTVVISKDVAHDVLGKSRLGFGGRSTAGRGHTVVRIVALVVGKGARVGTIDIGYGSAEGITKATDVDLESIGKGRVSSRL
jgi:hypothetical protein